MKIELHDIIWKKLQDAQENVRDFESYAKRVDDKEVIDCFQQLAEECGHQAVRLKELAKKHETWSGNSMDSNTKGDKPIGGYVENEELNPDDFE